MGVELASDTEDQPEDSPLLSSGCCRDGAEARLSPPEETRAAEPASLYLKSQRFPQTLNGLCHAERLNELQRIEI